MKEDKFTKWLEGQGLKKSSRRNTLSRCNKIEAALNVDLDESFDADRCDSLMETLKYKGVDAPLPQGILIDGDYYNGLASLRSAVNKYRQFRDSDAGCACVDAQQYQYLVYTKTPTQSNPNRAWMNIRVQKLQEAADAHADFYFAFDIEGYSLYRIPAQQLLTSFDGKVAQNRHEPLRWSFYVDFDKGVIYKTVSENDQVVVAELEIVDGRAHVAPDDAVCDNHLLSEYNISLVDDGVGSEKDRRTDQEKEYDNYLSLCLALSKYGMECTRVFNDTHGADFIAYHREKYVTILIQQKARMTCDKKYEHEGRQPLYMAFPSKDGGWYLVPHSWLYSQLEKAHSHTPHWKKYHGWNSATIKGELEALLQPFKL